MFSKPRFILGWFDDGSGTGLSSRPRVEEVRYFDDTTRIITPIGLTSNLILRIIFNQVMDNTVEPTIVLEDDSGTNPVVPGGGVWESTFQTNDTYVTPATSLVSAHVGTVILKVGVAQNTFAVVMTQDDLVEQFDVIEQPNLIVLNSFTVAEGPYVNAILVNLIIDADNAVEMQFSLDGITFSVFEAFSTTKSNFDITDSAIGGTVGEGLKIIYIILKDAAGSQTNGTDLIEVTYDNQDPTVPFFEILTEIGGSIILPAMYQPDNTPVLTFTTPPSIAPMRGFAWALDADPGEINLEMTEKIESGLEVTKNVGVMTLDISAGFYYVNRTRVSTVSDTVVLDVADGAQDRIDLVYVDSDDNTIKVLKGILGATTAPELTTSSSFPLAKVEVDAAIIDIVPGDITDVRDRLHSIDFINDPLDEGQHEVRIQAVDSASNTGPIQVVDIWVRTGQSDVGEILGWDSVAKINPILNNTWQNISNSVYLEWVDPLSPLGDTFFYTIDGTEPTLASSFTTNTFITLGPFADGITIIKIKGRDGDGVFGPTRIFTLSYSLSISGDITMFLED